MCTLIYILAASAFFALPLGILTSCNADPDDPPPPITVTKDVAVSFPAYTSGQTSISFAPTYTPDGGWGDHFSASDITYTVTCTELAKTYDSTTGFIASIGEGYADFNIYAFTQTFKLDSTVIGSQIIKVTVMGGNFMALKDANDNTITDIPSVPLTLSKEVQQ